jgi:dihydrofolate reductase
METAREARTLTMGKVIFNMTMSLDGFVAGPNDSPENGLGDGGDRLFHWYFSGDAAILNEAMGTFGAMVTGRRTFDIARGWGGHPPGAPCFVLTHTTPQEWVKNGSPFVFVTDGIESAIRQARQAAGNKNVVVSTASTLQQCLKAGLMDEIHIDVVPVLLGAGVRLFDQLGIGPIELESIRVIEAPGVTHLGFRVVKQTN